MLSGHILLSDTQYLLLLSTLNAQLLLQIYP